MKNFKFRAWIGEMVDVEIIDWEGSTLLVDRPAIMDQRNDVWPLEDATMELWSGVHDKNGTPIYEGDILKYKDGELLKVFWDDRWCGFGTLTQYGEDDNLMHPTRETNPYEVVGNIHENPDLWRMK